MYAVTREPMTDSDRESVAQSYAPRDETAWLALGVAACGLIAAVICGVYVARTVPGDFRVIVATGVFVLGIVVCAFASWKLLVWFSDRHYRVGVRDRYQLLMQTRTIEVIHFRADAAWEVPEDPFDNDDDRLGVLYRLGSDAFAFTPLYEFSLPDAEARVAAEVRMRRTPPPNPQQLTEFVAVNSETLPLRDELAHFEGLPPGWADDLRELAAVGGKLKLSDLPTSWQSIVEK